MSTRRPLSQLSLAVEIRGQAPGDASWRTKKSRPWQLQGLILRPFWQMSGLAGCAAEGVGIFCLGLDVESHILEKTCFVSVEYMRLLNVQAPRLQRKELISSVPLSPCRCTCSM